MFIRLTTKKDKSSEKIYNNYQLVESYRTEKGPRQRILLTIGSNHNLAKKQRKLLSNRIEELVCNIEPLIPYSNEIEALAEQFAIKLLAKRSQQSASLKVKQTQEKDKIQAHYEEVDLNSLKTYQARTIGAEYILHETLKELGLDSHFLNIGMSQEEAKIAVASIIARAAFPGSDLRTHRLLQQKSGLGELLDIDFETISHVKMYRLSDKLLNHKEGIEAHLEQREKKLFNLKETIVLYDLTNIYCEGLAERNPKACHGRSKEKRSDCPLISLGIVLDTNGFPKRSEFFEGNVVEQKTLKGIISKLSEKQKVNKPVIVMDAGFVSQENLDWLTNEGYPYITVFRKKSLDLLNAPNEGEWKIVKESSDNVVRAVWKENNKTNERHLYCTSTARLRREEKIRKKKQKRFEEELSYLRDGLNQPRRLKKSLAVEQKVGKLKERYKRVARFYDIQVNHCNETNHAIDIQWTLNENDLLHDFDGGYCLRTTLNSVSADELWELYIMLSCLENAFREMKSELGLRPVYHQLEHRVDGHMFITLLAYHLTHTIKFKLEKQNISHSWATIRDIFSTQIRVTTKVTLKNGKTSHIRTTTEPESEQRKICRALGYTSKPLKKVEVTYE